jgi:hypothetical protein
MNKLLIFPMGFMFVLTLFSLLYVGGTYTADSQNYSSQQGFQTDNKTGYVTIPTAKQQTFNISTATGIMLILTIAIAIGIVAGIKVLGSGLSDPSQSMIFNGILFGGLWACLSIVSSQFLFDTMPATMLWMTLTIVYIIGMGIHLNPSGSG